jgi:hypothetical protein
VGAVVQRVSVKKFSAKVELQRTAMDIPGKVVPRPLDIRCDGTMSRCSGSHEGA